MYFLLCAYYFLLFVFIIIEAMIFDISSASLMKLSKIFLSIETVSFIKQNQY